MTRILFKVLRRKVDQDLLHNGVVNERVSDTLRNLEQYLIQCRGGGFELDQLMGFLHDLLRYATQDRSVVGQAIREIQQLDPYGDRQSLLDDVFSMLLYVGCCERVDRARNVDAWLHLLKDQITTIRVEHANEPAVIDRMVNWMIKLDDYVDESGTIAVESVMGHDHESFLTNDFEVPDPAPRAYIAIFPLSFMVAAIDGIKIPARLLTSLIDLAGRPGATGIGGDFEVKIVDPIIDAALKAMKGTDRTKKDDDAVTAMQNLVQLLMTETSEFKTHIPLFNTFWKQAVQTDPPDMQPFADDINAAKLLWTAAEKAHLSRRWRDWVVETGRPFARVVDKYLDDEKTRGDANPDKDKGFDQIKALLYVCYGIDSAFRQKDHAKARAIIDQLEVPAKVRAALTRIAAFHERIEDVEHGGFARLSDALRNDERYFFIDAAQMVEKLMAVDIKRMLAAGERAKLSEVADWLSAAGNTRGDLKRLVNEFMPKWQALSAGHEQWDHLTRDYDLNQLTHNAIWNVQPKARAAVKMLDNAAPLLVAIFRETDALALGHRPSAAIADIIRQQHDEQGDDLFDNACLNLARYGDLVGRASTGGSVAPLARLWPHLKDQTVAIDADKDLLTDFLREVGIAREYLAQSLAGCEALDTLQRLTEATTFYCVDVLNTGFGDSEGSEAARQLARAGAGAEMDRLSAWIYRLGTMTGIGNSTIKVIAGELLEWNGPNEANIKQNYRKELPKLSDDLDHITSVRQRAAALPTRMRLQQLATLKERVKPRGKAAMAVLGDPAALQAVYVLGDEIRALVNPPRLEVEWASPNARAWAHLAPPPSIQPLIDALVKFLGDVKDIWRQDLRDMKKRLSRVPKAIDNTAIRGAFEVLAAADPYMSSYLMEAVPDLLNLLKGGVAGPDAAPGFLEDHTIDFRLHAETGIEELSSMVPQNMVLELINMTPDTVTLGEPVPPPDLGAGAPPCHFILRFRRGTLRADLANIGLEGPPGDWNVVGFATRPEKNPEYDELFIAGPPNHKILTGQSRHLVLTQMQGADFGTRNTRVLMLHQGLKGPKGPLDPGRREKRLSVVHALPQTAEQVVELPIYAGFVSDNAVLNDGAQMSSLRIDLTSMVTSERQPQVRFWNIGKRKPGEAGQAHDFWSRSKIILSVDTQDDAVKDDKGWALCNKSQAMGIHPTLKRQRAGKDANGNATTERGLWRPTFTSLGARASWVFTPPLRASDDDLILERGKSLKLDIDNIQSALPDGVANLYVRIENIPGYPDREYILPVRKTAVLEVAGKIGIGTVEPKVTLDVHGDMRVGTEEKSASVRVHGGASVDNQTVYDWAEVGGKLSVSRDAEVDGALTVAGVTHASLPVGVIMPYVGTEPPPGWLHCDGQQIPDGSSYYKLRELLAKTHGLDVNRDVIKTPNLIARTVVGAAQNDSARYWTVNEAAQAGITVNFPNYLNLEVLPHNSGGEWQHALDLNEMPRHQHFGWGENYAGWTYGNDADASHKGSSGGQDYDNRYYGTSWVGGTNHTEPSTDRNGPGNAHTNVQPYLALLYIIKY